MGLNMIVSEKLKILIAKFRLLCYALGIEFMDPNYRFNRRTLVTCVLISSYLVGTVYTLVTVDMETKWKCLTSVSLGAQGAIKYYAALRYHQKANEELHQIIEMYSSVEVQGQYTDKCKLLASCVKVCNRILNLYLLIFVSGFVMLVSYPLVMLFVFNQKEFMIITFIPGVDPYGELGFFTHFVCQTFMVLIACVGTPGADFYFIFGIAHIDVYIEFLRLRIKSLNDWLLDPETDALDTHDWHGNVIEKVVDIMKEHQYLLNFMYHLDELFFLPIAVHIGTATISLGIALYLLVTSTWIIASQYVLIALFQLLVYSLLGTIVESKNDHLNEYVYEIMWYLLPLAEQMKVKLLLAKCQRPKKYTVAGLATLNFATCVSILKTIYSFFMMLLNTL